MLNRSIVTARNMGLEPKDREQTRVQIETFLLSTMDLHGLARSDVMNIALEKYLVENGYLSEKTLLTIEGITQADKTIFSKGLY